MRILLLAATVVTGLVLPADAPASASSVCSVFTPTISASSGAVAGTSGDDVVVVSGSVTQVDTLEGDDVVCLADTTALVTVHTGSGNDEVTAAASSRTSISTGAGDDYVNAGRTGVDTGSGDDTIDFFVPYGEPSDLNLGKGDDTIRAGAFRTAIVDLAAREITLDGVSSPLHHAEDVEVVARRVVVEGDGDDNSIRAGGCRVDLSGGAGNDSLAMVDMSISGPSHCGTRRAQETGGPGSDQLRGYGGDDLLVGGPGRDYAYGAGGRDHCVAERRVKCES